MKCDGCPAIINVGNYEYPEYDCRFWRTVEELHIETQSGCKWSAKKVEKLVEEYNKEGIKA